MLKPPLPNIAFNAYQEPLMFSLALNRAAPSFISVAEMSLIDNWLTREFRSASTRWVYKSGLKDFLKFVGAQSVETYLSGVSPEGFLSDLRSYINAKARATPPKTLNAYVTAIRLFFAEHGLTIDDSIDKLGIKLGDEVKRLDSKLAYLAIKVKDLNSTLIKLFEFTKRRIDELKRLGGQLDTGLKQLSGELDELDVKLRDEINRLTGELSKLNVNLS